ncbi:ATP-binding protein [Candidatus Poriferisocius sp.]|uniref:ATP-binding protein n=1 Tax=Candidatus Poriferisocius sp. TaxID=3101276 RepID=UPI003B5BB30E
MTRFERPQVATIVERLNEPPQRIIAIFGPRQTGKTTAVLQALERIQRPWRYEAMDQPPKQPGLDPSAEATSVRTGSLPDRQELVRIWEDSRHRAFSSPEGFVLVLDEIQKIDDWANTVKGLWDQDRAIDCPLHVVILGSAPLLLQQGINETLAGRFEPIRHTHWSYSEMSEAFGFSVDEYVYFGGFPGAAPLISDQARWAAYVRDALIEPAVERDLLAMVRVDKPALLRRLLELSMAYSGQILSYNKMLGQLQEAGNTTTLAGYLRLLDRVGLVSGLQKHRSRAVSAKSDTPKLIVLNTALMAVRSDRTFDEARADRSFWGRMVESTVGAHLLNSCSTATRVKYWRMSNREVDFVLQRGPRLVAIEVKSGRTRETPAGLLEFKEQFKFCTTLVVGDSGIPLQEFLSSPADHWLEKQ